MSTPIGADDAAVGVVTEGRNDIAVGSAWEHSNGNTAVIRAVTIGRLKYGRHDRVFIAFDVTIRPRRGEPYVAQRIWGADQFVHQWRSVR